MYKKLKKMTAALLAAMMLFGCVSCSGKKDTDTKTENTPVADNQTPAAEGTKAAENTPDSGESTPETTPSDAFATATPTTNPADETTPAPDETTPTPDDNSVKISGLGVSVKDKTGLLMGHSVGDYEVSGDEEFGGIFLGITIEDFNASGFAFGDSVDVEFSNGYKFEDLPYYNGYYVDAGSRLLIGYPGYGYIKLAENYGQDLFVVAGLSETDTAVVTLREKAKYLGIQEAMDIHYEDERTKYPSDEVFANFRAVSVGDLKENMLYRSASPVDNQHKRAPYADMLASMAGIAYDVDLSDNEEKLKKHMSADDFGSQYFMGLYDEGKVIALAMSMNYFSDTFLEKLRTGFVAMSENDGPYLVHCVEGKDRTGLFCMILEAFAGASYQEIVDDYMLTYENYFKFTKESEPEKYEIIKVRNLDRMIKFMCGDDESIDITTADLKAQAEAFMKKIGMKDEEIEALRNKLVK